MGDSTDSTPDDGYIVEKIVGRKVMNGRPFYLIQWKGYIGQNTWEPEENLDCPQLVALFEEREKSKEIQKKDPLSLVRTGFDKGYVAERIIGATDSTGQLMLCVKWQGVDEAELVPACIANVQCPQVVIEFYESRVKWDGLNIPKNPSSVTVS